MTRAEYRLMGEQFDGEEWTQTEVDWFRQDLTEDDLDGLRTVRDGMNDLMSHRTATPTDGTMRRVWIERQRWEVVD